MPAAAYQRLQLRICVAPLLYAGLFLPRLNPEELTRAVTLAREAGSQGVSLFSLNSLSVERLAAFKRVSR